MKMSKHGMLSTFGVVCGIVVPAILWAQSSTSNMSVADAPLSDVPVADMPLGDTPVADVPTAAQDKAMAAQDAPMTITSESVAAELPDDAVPGDSGLSFGPGDRFQLDGFFSSGGSQTTANNSATYSIPEHGAVDTTMTFDPSTILGLQLTAKLTDQLSVIGQFVASGDGTNGNTAYEVDSTWAFLQYQPIDTLSVDLGRVRLPLFLYSDTLQVGYTYPYFFLPNEVYRVVPFSNITGLNVDYKKPLGDSSWTFELQPFAGAGTSQYDVNPNDGTDSSLTDFDENSMYGGAATLSNDHLLMRAAYSKLLLSATEDLRSTNEYSDEATSFYSFGGKISISQLFLQGEYAHRDVPDSVAALTGYYATLGLHVGKWLPTVTYGHLKTDNIDQLNSGSPTELLQKEAPEAQYSWTGSVAYYVNSMVDLKVMAEQIHPLDGTNGMFNQSPGKANVMMYGFGADVIF